MADIDSSQQTIQLRLETQQSPVADPVSAITAVVRPILFGTLHALRYDRVERLGGYEAITLQDLAREYRAGDGDCGICFEYAVHDAVGRFDPMVLERVEDVLSRFCKIKGTSLDSILFGAEKSGSQRLIDTASELLTKDSLLMVGKQGRPVFLRRHIERAARAFRNSDERRLLPASIRGVWKADLFLGRHDTDKWVATTVKINPTQLEAAAGLRVGIVPAKGIHDQPYTDDSKNLIVCPLLHDGAFMEIFFAGFEVVQTVIAADAKMPKPVALTRADARQVAQRLVERAAFPVLEIIDALKTLEQPHLLTEATKDASLITPDLKAGRSQRLEIGGVLAPVPASSSTE